MELEQKKLAVTKSFLKIARLQDEYYQFVETPGEFVKKLKQTGSIQADLFTFIQEIPDPTPKYSYHLEYDSAAVVPLTTYEHWWKKQVNDKTRNMVRKGGKAGVEIREVEFNDELVRGIEVIYNECPVRQGRPFKHFGKDFETIKREHSTFLDRSQFFGSYFNGQLIGFVKLVHGRGVSSLMNIISMISHRDKAPTNGLIAKAIEVCTEKNIPLLQYGTGNARSIGDFKKHHAFKEHLVPRYFVPLNLKGALLLKLGFHKPMQERIPEAWRDRILSWRARWNSARLKNNRPGTVPPSGERRAQA